MALSIGNVNFGVDAQTQGLQKAVAALQRFEKQVNRVARSQSKGAQGAVNAMARQESAIKKAYQQVLALRQGFNRLENVSPQSLARITQSFQVLTREMTSGKLSTLEYTRSLDAFNTRIGRSQRELRSLQAEQRKTAQSTNGLTQTMRNLESASVLAVGPLSGLGARIRSMGAIITRTDNLMTAAAFGGIAAMTLGLAKLSSSFVRSGVEFEKSMARFRAAAGGNVDVAARDMLFVIDTSREFGLRIQDNIKAFSRMTAAAQGTTLQGKGVQDVFKGVSAAAAALKMDTLEVEGVFRALEQMISKGTVQAEELRGQLGERLPGAFQIAARSMGMTTMELGKAMEQGRILAEDMLPKLAKALEETYGDEALKNVNSLTGAMNNLANVWFMFTAQGDKISKASIVVTKAINGLARALELVNEHAFAITKVLMVGAGVLTGYIAAWAIMAGATMVANIMALARGFGLLTRAVTFFNIAANANPATTLARGLLRLGAVVAGVTGSLYVYEKLLGDVDSLMEELTKSAERAGPAIEDVFTPPGPDTTKFLRQIEELQERIDAMRQGPRALERYESIDAPIRAFAEALADAGIQGEQQIEMLNRYGNAIRAIYALQKNMSDLAQQSANAIANSFEEAVFSGNKLKDVIKSLIVELIRLTLRAQIFGPMAEMLGGRFGSSGFKLPKMFTTPTEVITGSAGGQSQGGSVRAGGQYRVNELGQEYFKPKVNGNISPARAGSGGGGTSVHLTINAPGADEGTIARIREIVSTQMAPQIVKAATVSTIKQLQRPRFS